MDERREWEDQLDGGARFLFFSQPNWRGGGGGEVCLTPTYQGSEEPPEGGSWGTPPKEVEKYKIKYFSKTNPAFDETQKL